jgi:hypothetical protein
MWRWTILIVVGSASTGLIAVGVAMNFAFGSSFGRTVFESYAYGGAFGFADVLKVAAPLLVAKSIGHREWGAATVGLLIWGTFTFCSAVSAIGFASANRTFTVDTRIVQAALNQSRLVSLEADQSELRRLRDRLASPEVSRSERLQLGATAQRLAAAIGATRGKLEDSAPVVSTPNPQAHTLASLTGVGIDKVETGLILLVALLVEMGGLGPFVTMSLAKVPRLEVPVKASAAPEPEQTAPGKRPSLEPPAGASPNDAMRPRLIHSAAGSENLESDLGRFLNLHARPREGSTLGSTELLARYNGSRQKRGYPVVTQRRFGDTMSALGHRQKLRHSGGRIHYQGLAWAESGVRHDATCRSSRHCESQQQAKTASHYGDARKRWVEPIGGLIS